MTEDRARWTHVRCTYRGSTIRRGLQARIADPFWMLSRQWQFGAFHGDDASTPAKIEVEHVHVPVNHLTPPGGNANSQRSRKLGPNDLVESIVEAEKVGTLPGSPRMSGEAGLFLLKLLPKNGRAKAKKELQKAFPLKSSDQHSAANSRIMEALVRGSFDGAALRHKLKDDPAKLAGLTGGAAPAMLNIAKQWLTYCEDRFEQQSHDSNWKQEAMEYRFDLLAGPNDGSEIRLHASDYSGDGLDWHQFDIQHDKLKEPGKAKREWLLPTKLAYSGMPAERFWDFEESSVYFGGITVEESSIAQMVLAEFATVYSDDWYLVPVSAKRGSLSRIKKMRVYDNFGEVTEIESAAVLDGKDRVWRGFELKGDTSVERDEAPWLFLPRTAIGGELGKAVERVYFTRDEMANLAWGIEELVEGAGSYPVDRRQHWNRIKDELDIYTGEDPEDESSSDPDTSTASQQPISVESEQAQPWKYRLITPLPPHWVPFQPEIINQQPTAMLTRSRMREWDLLGDRKKELAGSKGMIMNSASRMAIADEELLRGGIIVERNYQSARGPDGKLHIWASRRKLPGSGDIPSGRKTDWIERGGRG